MFTQSWWEINSKSIFDTYLWPMFQALFIMVIGLALARVISRTLQRFLKEKTTPHRTRLFEQGVYYGIMALFAIMALQQIGFDFGVLLGTAGILTIALGFASQTSASNLISGLFLIVEQPFAIGDVIRVNDVFGEVLAIDLLSTKIRTFDNAYIRVPNELIIKTPVTNITKFPIRRIDLKLKVAYKEDIERVRTVLFAVADENPLCLEEPAPIFIFLGYGESSLDLQFSVWVRREEYLSLLNSIYIEIKVAFDSEGIEIPYPHRSLYTGATTDPLPITLVNDVPSPTNDQNGVALGKTD